jgi:hypothetical protein
MTHRTLLFSANGEDTENYYASHTPALLDHRCSQTNVGRGGIHATAQMEMPFPHTRRSASNTGIQIWMRLKVVERAVRARQPHLGRIDISRWFIQRTTHQLCIMYPQSESDGHNSAGQSWWTRGLWVASRYRFLRADGHARHVGYRNRYRYQPVRVLVP